MKKRPFGVTVLAILAALLVATVNFSGTDTLTFVLVGTVIMLLILLPVAKRLGAGSEAAAAPVTQAE